MLDIIATPYSERKSSKLIRENVSRKSKTVCRKITIINKLVISQNQGHYAKMYFHILKTNTRKIQ